MNISFKEVILTILIIASPIIAMENLKESPLFLNGKAVKPLEELLVKFDIHETALATVTSKTQEKWLRTAGKERWEAQDPYAHLKSELMPLFSKLNLINEIKPNQKHYNYLLILGGLFKRTQSRLQYCINLWQEGTTFDQIILLGSHRPLDPKEEPSSLFTNAQPHTEYEMMRYLYDTCVPAPMKNIPAVFINTPNTVDSQGKIKRATTGDTIQQWLHEHKPATGDCLVISSQPHIGYQESVIKTFLPAFTISSAGPSLQEDKTCEILDALARWIYQENIRIKS